MSTKTLDLIEKVLNFIDNASSNALTSENVSKLDTQRTVDFIENSWKTAVLGCLKEYIETPNASPNYDEHIHTNGYQEAALKILIDWVKSHNISGLTLDVLHDKGKTPLIYMELPASNDNIKDTILMYGHFDKQPPLTDQWDTDLHPYKPVIKNGKLYGRGGADDGYAIFAAIDCIRVLKEQGLDHPRICTIIEGSEESGSIDLVYYLNKLKDRIGTPGYIICLDSGCANYEQFCCTVSLRGILIAYLKTSLLTEGIHSGSSGLVRDSFHALRIALDRIDNSKTGDMIKQLYCDIPESHVNYAKKLAKVLGHDIVTKMPLNHGCNAQIENISKDNLHELILNSTWRPQLCITGCQGIPDLRGGNVLRKYTKVKLSIRLPPTMDPDKASKIVKNAIEKKPTPWNANIECILTGHAGKGFVVPEYKSWLYNSIQNASQQFFGKESLFVGVGGSIPVCYIL